MRILIAHGSTHGQTARVAERIAARMRDRGAEVFVVARPAFVRADGYDAIVVGGRVHGSRYPWRVTRFIRKNLATLRTRPSAFFSVSLLQLAADPARRLDTQTLPARRIPKLGWMPDRVEVIAGALKWKAQYGWLAPLFKRTWRHVLGDALDLSLAEQVFTDWEEVDRFADEFLDFARRGLETQRATKAGADQAAHLGRGGSSRPRGAGPSPPSPAFGRGLGGGARPDVVSSP